MSLTLKQSFSHTTDLKPQTALGSDPDSWRSSRVLFLLRIEDWGDLKKSGTGRNFDGELRSKSHNLGRF